MNTSFIKTKFLLFLTLFYSFSIFCQRISHVQQVDSLISVANKTFKQTNQNQKFLLICENALKIAQSENYKDGIAASYYQISRYYSKIHNDEKMFSNILLAEEYAEKGTNNYLKANIISSKALCYNHYHQFKEAEKNYKTAIIFAEKIENSELRHLTLSKIYSNFSSNLDAMGANINEIIAYDKKALEEDLQLAIPDNLNISASYSNLGISYITIKDYKIAEIYYQKALLYATKANDQLMVAKIIGMMAEIEFNNKNYQKALGMYKEGLVFKSNPDILEQSYMGLAIVYDSLKNSEKANLFYGKYAKLKDSLAIVEKSKLKIPLDTIEKEQQKSLKKNSSFFIYSIMIGLMILFGLGYFYFLKINKTRRHIELLTEKINSELTQESTQLQTKVNDSFTEVLELAKTNDPAFLSRFQELYPEYCKNLKAYLPDITQNELHFCGFLKLKFSTKDIAEYQFVTPKAIQNRKNKLRRRLNLDPKTDLYEYLDTFN